MWGKTTQAIIISYCAFVESSFSCHRQTNDGQDDTQDNHRKLHIGLINWWFRFQLTSNVNKKPEALHLYTIQKPKIDNEFNCYYSMFCKNRFSESNNKIYLVVF